MSGESTGVFGPEAVTLVARQGHSAEHTPILGPTNSFTVDFELNRGNRRAVVRRWASLRLRLLAMFQKSQL